MATGNLRGIRFSLSRLNDPHLAHERLAAREYGAKSSREIDEDVRTAVGQARQPAADRVRVTGNWSDKSAQRETVRALEQLGLVTDETDDDIDDQLPYERNAGVLYRGVKPSIAAGAAAGTTPTLSISEGTDHRGRITLVVGTTPGTGTLATITFAVPLRTASYTVGFKPADSDASTAAGRSVYCNFATQSETSFEMNNSTALVAGTSYHWWYEIGEFIEL